MVQQWPTPMVSDVMRGSGTYMRGNPTLKGAAASWPTPIVNDATGSTHCYGPKTETGDRAIFLKLPSAAAMWGTPTTRDWKDGACADANVPVNGLLGRQAVRSLQGQQTPTDGATTSKSGRSLNPLFVEALMGWPRQWTDVTESTDCAPAETASYLSRPPSPGELSGKGPDCEAT